jgi:hypothetical protein
MNKSINFLKDKKGKFLNFKDINKTYFVDSFINATPIPNIKDAIKLSEHFNMTIKSVDVDVFSKEYSKVVSKIVIIGDILYSELKRYNDDIPVIPGVNKHTRNAVKNATNKLKEFHQMSTNIINDGKDDDFFDASGDFEELINLITDALDKGDVNNLIKKLSKKNKVTS